MTTAIPHGTVSGRKYHGCTCLRCYNATARYQAARHRQQGYGTWQPLVNAGPARAHLEQLHAQGMTWRQIATAANVDVEYLCQLRLPVAGHPRFERIRPERAATLLAVRFQDPPLTSRSSVPAVGSMRRVRALRANGWPNTVLATRSGVARATVDTIANDRNPSLYAATADSITELYEDLHDQDPHRHGVTPLSVERSIGRAKRLGWVPPRAWDGIDIDNPDSKPGPAGKAATRYAPVRTGDERRRAIVEDTAELAAQGLPREVIAARIGVAWGTVQQAHIRCGVPVPAVAS